MMKNKVYLTTFMLVLSSCQTINSTSPTNNINANNSFAKESLTITQLQHLPLDETNLKIKSFFSSNKFGIKSDKFKAGDLIPGRYIVKFKNKADDTNLIKEAGAKVLGNIKKTQKVFLLEANDLKSDTVLEDLKNNPDVEYITQDSVMEIHAGRPSYLPPLLTPTTTPTPAPYTRPTYLPNLNPTAPVASKYTRPTYLPPLLSATPTAIPTTTPTATPTAIPTPPPPFAVNDTFFSQQYAHPLTQSTQGWGISLGSNTIKIAIVDTGVEATHEDLANKLLPGYSTVAGSPANVGYYFHGTHVAGIAAAETNNNKGIAGYAPLAKIIPVKVSDGGYLTTSEVVTGITWATDNGADVINLSLGSPSNDIAMQNAVNYALTNGKIVVASMGNSNNNQVSYPAAYNGVIAVGATNNTDTRWDEGGMGSQYGTHISVSAPGFNIYSTMPIATTGVNYANASGTSMAAPAVSGLAALLKGYKPSLTNVQIKQKIEQNCDDKGAVGFDQYFGHGRINVYKTLLNS